MRRSVSVLSFILALAVFTGCTLQNVQPVDVPPPDTAPYTQPSGPYIVLERPDTLYYLIDYDTYFVPEIRDAVFFVDGAWYLHHGDRWYRGRSYNGPWVYIGRGNLPPRLDKLPRDYRSKIYRKQRVPYGHWDKVRERARPQPPDMRIQKPEYLYLLTPYGVYYVPDERHEIFFADGSWYTRYRDTWFTGESYRGPWSQADPRSLPSSLRKLPADYRSPKLKRDKVSYGHWEDKRNREDKRNEEKDVRPDSKPPARDPHKIKESKNGRLPSPGPQEPPLPNPRVEAKSDKRPEKKEQAPSRKGSDDKVDKIARPEVLRYVEKLDIYFIPEIAEEILYYKDTWYLRDKGKWLIGEGYNGPWSTVDKKKVPKSLTTLPGNYRTDKYPSIEVPYGHWQNEENRGKRKR